MAESWKELLESLRKQVDAGNAPPSAEIWRTFEDLAKQSRSADVQRLPKIGAELTADDRVRFAIGVLPLLMSLDWPASWEQARQELVAALEQLIEECYVRRPESLAAEWIGMHDEATAPSEQVAMAAGFGSLYVTLEALRRPCPPSELRTYALLLVSANLPFRRAAKDKAAPWSPAGAQARARYLRAFERYARAASAMNSVIGAVVFERLDLGTEA